MPYQPYQPTWNNPYLPQATTPQYAGYQPSVTQPYQQPVNGVEKVSGKDSLWQLPMPPNSTSKPYFDHNGKFFYIVTTDAAGAKTIETFDFYPHKEEKPVQIDGAQFVSKQEYDQFVAKVSAALEAIDGVHAAVPNAGTAGNATTAGATQDAAFPAPFDDAGGHVGGGAGVGAK